MRKLAAELAVGPMTLYYHVPDRSALEDLIFDAVMSEVDFSDDAHTLAAGQRAVRLGWSIRTALLTHPNTVPITLSRSARTPTQLRPVEMMLGVLYDIGLNPTDAIAAVDIIGRYVFGTTLADVNHLAQEERATQAPQASDETGIPPRSSPTSCAPSANPTTWVGTRCSIAASTQSCAASSWRRSNRSNSHKVQGPTPHPAPAGRGNFRDCRSGSATGIGVPPSSYGDGRDAGTAESTNDREA